MTYAPRLTTVESELAEKANQIDLITTNENVADNTANIISNNAKIAENSLAISNIGSSTPKGAYATVVALTTAFPTGNSNIYVVTADGKWYYWNGSAWVAGGVYQASALEDKSVTQDKTSFLAFHCINLFNKDTSILNNYIAYDTGIMAPYAGYQASDWIKIKPNTVYSSTSPEWKFVYDANKNYIQHWGTNVFQITTPSNAAYYRTNTSNNNVGGKLVDMMFVEGDTLPSVYTPYDLTYILDSNIDIKQSFEKCLLKSEMVPNNIITEKMTTFLKNINLFDKLTVIQGKYISWIEGSINTNASYFYSDWIEVEPSTVYTSTSGEWKIAYDSNKNFITSWHNGETEITTPSNAKYIRFNGYLVGSSGSFIDNVMFVVGNTLPLAYMPYGLMLNAFMQYANILNAPTMIRKWLDKIWNALGDSITNGVGTTPYRDYCKTDLSMALVRNYGIGSSTIADIGQPSTNPMCNRYVDMDDNADLITVFGGVNDAGNAVPIGTINDTVKTTFYGALNVLCLGLLAKYPSAKIALFTPLKQNSTYFSTSDDVLGTYADAIIKIGRKYSLPVLDLFGSGSFYPYNEAQKTLFTQDGIHPNSAGHRRIADRISSFLETI